MIEIWKQENGQLDAKTDEVLELMRKEFEDWKAED